MNASKDLTGLGGPAGLRPAVGTGGPRPRAATAGSTHGSPPGQRQPWPRPARPWLPAALAYRLQRLLAPSAVYGWVAHWLEASPMRYRLFTAAEKAVKREVFGCRMCGQCTLPVTGYACPMSCPKQLRNGPCGGVGADGSCEVYPGVRCVWLTAYERAERQGRVADLHRLHRPADHRHRGQSSWVSYWQHRDDGLWTTAEHAGGAPALLPAAPPATAGQP